LPVSSTPHECVARQRDAAGDGCTCERVRKDVDSQRVQESGDRHRVSCPAPCLLGTKSIAEIERNNPQQHSSVERTLTGMMFNAKPEAPARRGSRSLHTSRRLRLGVKQSGWNADGDSLLTIRKSLPNTEPPGGWEHPGGTLSHDRERVRLRRSRWWPGGILSRRQVGERARSGMATQQSCDAMPPTEPIEMRQVWGRQLRTGTGGTPVPHGQLDQ